MYGELITKRSPIVLIGKFASIEAGGLVLYLIAALLGDAKYEIYTRLFLTNFLPYMTARVIFLFAGQFALTVYAFLLWYYEEYKIRMNSIIHIRGVFKKREMRFNIDSRPNIIVKSSMLGKILHYGTIRVKNGSSVFELKHISRPERIAHAIEEESLSAAFSKGPVIEKLLKEEEDSELEFKSSLRFDYKAGNVNRELEKAAMKTIAAFLNSKGGYLVVGVDDKREPLGLTKDYKTLQRKDRDGFENHFTQTFNSVIGPEFRSLVKIWFHNISNQDICAIQALPSPRPVYFKSDSNEHFYMRTGNITTALKLSEIESYFRSRWPKRSDHQNLT